MDLPQNKISPFSKNHPLNNINVKDPSSDVTADSKVDSHDGEGSGVGSGGGLLLPSPYPQTLTLSIGGRTFKVSQATLLESGFFRRQLSDRYTWTPEADGSYFLDADPDLFAHLLRFMRRPEVFPLFYDKTTGFDYDLYNRLEAEARYFQLDALCEWIKEKKYLQAVKVGTSQPVTRDIDEVSTKVWQANRWEDWHIHPRTKKVYVCPRGIYIHRGNPGMCGAACAKAQGSAGNEYEEVVQVVSVEKEIVFDEKVCRVEEARMVAVSPREEEITYREEFDMSGGYRR